MSSIQRVQIHFNRQYKHDGMKSYVFAMRKFGFNATKPGPYFLLKTSESHRGHKHPHGHAHHSLRKHHGHGHGYGHGSGSAPALAPSTPAPAPAPSVPSTGSGSGTTEAGDVPAEDIQNDSLYLCPVDIGTPAQTLYLDFDTGSSDLWVWSTELPSSILDQANPQNQQVPFDASKSSTFKSLSDSTWQISYGDGSNASGDVGTDVVDLGGLKIEGQAVELAKNLSASFAQGNGSGLLGLAFSSLNTVTPTPQKTPTDNLIAGKDISQQLFTAYLGSWRDAGDADKGESFYTFGYIDQDTMTAAGTSEPNYADVDNSQGFWQIPSTSATINGQTVDRSNNTSIMDTGTTLCLVDDSLVDAIYAAIPGAKYDQTNQGYLFPSDTSVDDLPVITLAIGDASVTFQKEDLGFADAGNGMVYGSIQSRGSMNMDIYGDAVLKAMYAIFDMNGGSPRFGWVQRTEANQNTSVPPQSG